MSTDALLSIDQRAEHKSYMEKIQAETKPRAPRWSSETTRLRKTIENFTRLRRPLDAVDSKMRLQRLEAQEHSAWARERHQKIKDLEQSLLDQQTQERDRRKTKFDYALGQLINKHTAEREQIWRRYGVKMDVVDRAHQSTLHQYEQQIGGIFDSSQNKARSSQLLS